MTVSIFTLFIVEPAAAFLSTALDLAATIGLPVTSWREGDPALVLFDHQAEMLAARDATAAEYFKGGFLSTAGEDWGEVHAGEVYGITRTDSSPSTPTVTLHNAGGGFYALDAGDLSVKSSTSNVTFHSTSGGTLGAGATVTFNLVADVDGSDGNVDVNEIDVIVSPAAMIGTGVTITASTRSIGTDKQSLASLKQDCRDSLGALSPGGPSDAYEFVVRQSKFTGVETITRSASTEDGVTGDVTVYCAGPSGAVDGASVTAAQSAVDRWATPLAFTATAASAVNQSINVSATINRAGITSTVTQAIQALLARFPIAKDGTYKVGRDALIQAIRAAIDPALTDLTLSVNLTLPAADVTYVQGNVPVAGALTITEAP